MTTKRKQLVSALIVGLKIEEDIFAIETVKEKTEFLSENQYLDFYQAVMKDDSFGNGIKSVLKVAEQYKPQEPEDETRLKAKELIELVRSMNEAVYQHHIKTGFRYDDCLKAAKFEKVDEDIKAILSQVKPYFNYKDLVANINVYQTGEEAIKAFMTAIKFTPSNAVMIDNPIERLRIKR